MMLYFYTSAIFLPLKQLLAFDGLVCRLSNYFTLSLSLPPPFLFAFLSANQNKYFVTFKLFFSSFLHIYLNFISTHQSHLIMFTYSSTKKHQLNLSIYIIGLSTRFAPLYILLIALIKILKISSLMNTFYFISHNIVISRYHVYFFVLLRCLLFQLMNRFVWH